MQASSDIFPGWSKSGSGTDYYWWQLKDMTGSFDISTLDLERLGPYLAIYAACPARAHARSGDPIAISSYLGKSNVRLDAMDRFATVYADTTERDHQPLVAAIDNG